ncbi:MAG: aldo/keto reductase [bacterium]|nr:aldo/keto reductase [bacterium]
MTFGEEWGWGANKLDSRKVYDLYREAGGNFIDTANRYTEGTSEKFVGEFIASERESTVLATKYTLFMKKDDPNSSGNHRKNLVQSVDASLKRLNTDYIDLLWLHAWDYMTPVEEVMRALDDLVRAGKILYTGISDTPAWIVAQANTMADLRGWIRFNAYQFEYSLIERTSEREIIPMATDFEMAMTPWAILGGGVLSGKYLDKHPEEAHRLQEDSGRLADKNVAIARELKKVAYDLGCTSSQAAIAWNRQQNELIIPIIGARNEQQLKDNLGCLDVELSEVHLKQLDEITKIDPGFPHEFLTRDHIRDIVYGGTQDKIINHRR